jgi:voltage-dependent potassium channel beta subunit
MNYRRLGQSGLKVSELSFGSWLTFGHMIDDATAQSFMATAYDAGVNFFDNAEGYATGKSEVVMGQALKNLGWARDTWIVSSKVFFSAVGYDKAKPTQKGLSRKHVMEACDAALRRLRVDYLDLYFCHRPDPETPIVETVRAMSDLIHQGKVLYWGTSEWSAAEITEAYLVAQRDHLVPPTMEQPQYNLFVRERFEKEYAKLYTDFGLGTTIWSPLASGLLTGKYKEGIPAESRLGAPGNEWLKNHALNENNKRNLSHLPELQKIAQDLGLTLPRLAIAWCLNNPHVSTVILGATKMAQLTENLKATEDQKLLSADLLKKIDTLLTPSP